MGWRGVPFSSVVSNPWTTVHFAVGMMWGVGGVNFL